MNEAHPDPHLNEHLLALRQYGKEYNFVSNKFHKSQHCQRFKICEISKIVNNEDLREEYMLCRKKMSKNLGIFYINEMSLFHGTSIDAIRPIIDEGFDWRLCGRHGTNYGRGSYFARDSSYSACYCHTDSNGMKHMFLASVLIGKVKVGNSSMIREPVGYNSTVDKEQNPSIFVIYHIKQALPEYLITFKKPRPLMGRNLSQENRPEEKGPFMPFKSFSKARRTKTYATAPKAPSLSDDFEAKKAAKSIIPVESLQIASIPKSSAVCEGGDHPSSQTLYEQENAESDWKKSKTKAALAANSPTRASLEAAGVKDTDSNSEGVSAAPKNEENLQTRSLENKGATTATPALSPTETPTLAPSLSPTNMPTDFKGH